MSGAPVWSITGDADGEFQTHLVGIALAHHRADRAVLCTRIAEIADMIDVYEREA
ncbi:MAG: hypothetical protein ABI702_06460 [Burkholderiales bacterium]